MIKPSYIKEIKEFTDEDALKCLQAYVDNYEIIRLCKDKMNLDQTRLGDKTVSPHFLITGQSVVDFLFLHKFKHVSEESIHRIPDLHDIDIFNLKYTIRLSDDSESEFEIHTSNVNGYGSISGSHYNVTSSIKLPYYIKHERVTVNYVDVTDNLFSDYVYRNYSNRMVLLAYNILGFFNLNVNQIGLYINIDTDEIKLVYTESFKEFVKSKQIDLNPNNTSDTRFVRAFYKYSHLSILDKSTRSFNFLNDQISEVFYIDEAKIYKHFVFIYGYFNKFVEKYCTELSTNQINEIFQLFNKNIIRLFITKYGVIKPYFRMLYSKILDSVQKVKALTIDDNNQVNVDNNYDIKFKESFISDARESMNHTIISYDYILDENPENPISIRNAASVERFIKYDLFGVASLEVSLQMLSKKKLNSVIEYFKKNNRECVLSELFIHIGTEPKLLNRNVSDLLKVFNFIYVHDSFSNLFINYYDKNVVFDFILGMLNQFDIYIQSNYKSLKLSKSELFNMIIGYIEQGHYKMLFIQYINDRIFDDLSKNIEKIISNIIDNMTRKLVEFDPIIVYEGDYVLEELITGFDLNSEGKFLNHCVGGYSESVEQGRSIILRLYHKDQVFDKSHRETGFRYTCELTYDSNANFKVIQIRGYQNKNVEESHMRIANKLISKFVDVVLKNPERIKFHQQNPKVGYDEVIEHPFDLNF